jgi:RNA polymerase sigma factor (sigma-70 family)
MLRLIGEPQRDTVSPSDEPAAARHRDPHHALVGKCIRGDPVSERTLLTAVGPSVLAIVRRVMGAQSPEIDDVCQEACIGLLSALPSFRAECTVLHFACRVSLLTSLAARRRQGAYVHRVRDEVFESEELMDDAPSPAELIDSARRRTAVRELLDELPLSQAEVLALHVALGHTVEETSAMIGAPINTVRSRLRRGLSALRDKFNRDRKLREVIGGRHEQPE